MKVHIVTDGEYDDYRILAVCSDEDKAFKAKKDLDAHNPIETWEIDDLSRSPVFQECFWTVFMAPNGFIRSCYQSEVPIDEERKDAWLTRSDNYLFYIRAEKRSEAIEIATEKRTTMIQNNEWERP